MSHVICRVSGVTLSFFFFYKLMEVFGGGSVINEAYPSSFWVFKKVVASGTFPVNVIKLIIKGAKDKKCNPIVYVQELLLLWIQ